MPCNCDDLIADDRRLAREELDRLTRWMCGVFRHAEKSGTLREFPMDQQVWWAEHKRKDAEREAREQQRREEAYREKLKAFENLKKELGK